MNYGFIGTGNIATAIITGALRSGGAAAGQFHVYDDDSEVQAAFTLAFGVNGQESAKAVIECADIVFLAIKPNVYPGALPEIAQDIRSGGAVLVSLAAGQTLEAIERLGCGGVPIVRVMPNVNAAVCEAVSALCANAHVTPEQKRQVTSFFNLTGMTMEIDESLFGVFSAIAGCSPAFTYLFVDSLARGAQKNGMNKKQALAIAAQAVLGSARMLLDSGEHPWALIDKVCSPGGTTIEGVCTLQDLRFESAVVQAVDAAVRKDSQIRG